MQSIFDALLIDICFALASREVSFDGLLVFNVDALAVHVFDDFYTLIVAIVAFV